MKSKILLGILIFQTIFSFGQSVKRSDDATQTNEGNTLTHIWVYSPQSCSVKDSWILFSDTAVQNFYNNHFKCYEIPKDSVKYHRIVKKIPGITRPGHYFVDSSNRIVHKHLKSPKSPDQLIQIGLLALDTNNNYHAVMTKFHAGERNPEFLLQYLQTRKNALEITADDIDLLSSLIDSTNYNSAWARNFIYNYFFCLTQDKGYYYFSSTDFPFRVLLYERDTFARLFDTVQTDLRLNAILEFDLENLIKSKNKELLVKSAPYFNDTIPTYVLKNTNGDILLYLKGTVSDTINKLPALNALYYLETGDTSNFIQSEKEFLEKYKSNPESYMFLANYYFRNVGTDQFIQRASDFAEKAYSLDTLNFSSVGILAKCHYKLGNYKESLVYIDKAIKLYTENGISPSEFERLKEEITQKNQQ